MRAPSLPIELPVLKIANLHIYLLEKKYFLYLGMRDAGIIISHSLIITIREGEGNPRAGVGKL